MIDLVARFTSGMRLLNEGRIDEMKDLYHPEFRMIQPNGDAVGRDDVLELYRGMRIAFPDGRFELVRALQAGCTVVVELRFHGTHTGPFYVAGGSIPATGRTVSYRTCDVIDARDGKFVEWHAYFDQAPILAQLGIDEEE